MMNDSPLSSIDKFKNAPTMANIYVSSVSETVEGFILLSGSKMTADYLNLVSNGMVTIAGTITTKNTFNQCTSDHPKLV